jgi:hypothetical protein
MRTDVLAKTKLDFFLEMWYNNINRHPVLIDTFLKKGLNVCLILDAFGLESVKRMLGTFLTQLSVPLLKCFIAEGYIATITARRGRIYTYWGREQMFKALY